MGLRALGTPRLRRRVGRAIALGAGADRPNWADADHRRHPNHSTALVSHAGALNVTCMTAGGTTESCGGTGGSGDAVNVFHESTVRHVSSVTHVQVSGSGAPTSSMPVRCVNTAGTGFEACGGSVSTDGINVFHQSTVRHVSSMTHVVIVDWQRWAHIQASQSGSFTVQAAHQGGEWNVRHVTSVAHVAAAGGGLVIRDDTCLTCRMRVDHYNALVVQPHISGALRTWQVSQCGTTAALAINTNANRRDLWVMNRGNGNIYVGYGVTGHVALTTTNGWPLHATASAITTTARHSTALSIAYFPNSQGPLACISDLAGQTLQVMELLR